MAFPLNTRILALGTLMLSGCVTISDETARATMFGSLAKRASFDLGCEVVPADITLLGQTEYGVEKCGCKATYLATKSGWVMNSASGDTCSKTN